MSTKRQTQMLSMLQLILIAFFVTFLSSGVFAKGRDYYQIQVFRIAGKAQEEKVDKFLKTAYLPALHKAGIKKAGVFKPIEKDTARSGKYLYVWIPFTSLDHFAKTMEALDNDAVYQKDGIDFLGAPFDQVPFVRKESILLKAFTEQPAFVIPSFPTPPSQRIYELRSYEGPTENLYRKKVEMFNQGGEVALFKTLDFNALFYAEVISGSTMPNLMYMTTFADMAAHDAHWNAFRNSPEWKKLSAMQEYKNTVSKNVTILLHPTDYSDF